MLLKMDVLVQRCYSGPVQTGTRSFHFVRYRSEKWNAEGLRSDGNTSNRTVPSQTMDLLNDTSCSCINFFHKHAVIFIRIPRNGSWYFPVYDTCIIASLFSAPYTINLLNPGANHPLPNLEQATAFSQGKW